MVNAGRHQREQRVVRRALDDMNMLSAEVPADCTPAGGERLNRSSRELYLVD